MSLFKLLVCSFVALAFISIPALAGGMKRIKKEANFNAIVVGKTITAKDTTVVLHPNGKITGKYKADKITGAWNWSKGYYCRNVNVGKKKLGSNCLVVKHSGDQLLFIRDQGKGEKRTFTIN